MAWVGDGKEKRWEPEYQVVERDGWFVALQSHGDRWFSLKRDGYWVDPDQVNVRPEDGEGVECLLQTREMADAAIAKARRINSAC